VWLKHRSAHMGVANSVVLDRAGVLDGTATVPPGGQVEVDAEGAPTGLLKEGAQNLVKGLLVPFPAEDLAGAIARAGRVYAAEGLTHVTEAGIGGGWIGHSGIEATAYQLARRRGELPQRVELMTATEVLHPVPGHPDDDMPIGLDLGLVTGFGDQWLRLGPMKIFTDGALSSRTCAVTEPFCDHGGTGLLADDPEVLRERIVAAHRAGWRVAAHAIGDRAIDVALDAFAEAQRALPRPDVRHRIEHAAMVRPDQLPRFAELGVIPVPQARFLYEIGDSMADAVGQARMPWLYRHQSFLDSGVGVPASSDRPCVSVGAPLSGMRSMVERTTREGRVLSTEERVDAMEALRTYTTRSAFAGHAETERGRITAGLLADVVLLDDDPTTVPSNRIDSIGVLATFVGGQCVHGTETIAHRCDGPIPARP
jgi:predicted amidohydrolase YtcJ